jgi:hypothetical protein
MAKYYVTKYTAQSSTIFRTSSDLDMIGSSQCLYKHDTVPPRGGGAETRKRDPCSLTPKITCDSGNEGAYIMW